MRLSSPSSLEQGRVRLSCTSTGNRSSRQGNAVQRHLRSFESPPRMKHHRSGPSMSAERFLFLVAELQARANELWTREQKELQRGAELMVICVTPPTQCPHNHTTAHDEQVDPTGSPGCVFDHPALLQPHANMLNSPLSLLASGTHQFGSPNWSNDFHAIATSLGLASQSADYAAGSTVSEGLHGTRSCGSGQATCHGGNCPPQNDAVPSSIWQPLGPACDAEAFITLQHPTLGDVSGGGDSGMRVAKARLVDRFDGTAGVGGTALARQAQHSTDFF